MKTVKLGKNIYPKVESLDEVKEKLVDRFGIKLYFLFEDGIEFHYPDHLRVLRFPGDISFYDGNRLILYFEESFSTLNFFLSDDSLYFSIEIENLLLTDSLIEGLKEKLKVEVSENTEEEENG